jgi:hypothetical protein
VRGIGHVIYRCAECRNELQDPWFDDGVTTSHALPAELTPDLRAYHFQHLPVRTDAHGNTTDLDAQFEHARRERE